MNSSTGLTLTHSCTTPVPLTQFVMNAFKAMAIKQGCTCLKFTNKKGIELRNSDWIAGVDHNNPCKNQNNEESNSDDDDSDEKHTPELEQCESNDDSSDNETHADEDIKEERDNLVDDDGNDDTPELEEISDKHR